MSGSSSAGKSGRRRLQHRRGFHHLPHDHEHRVGHCSLLHCFQTVPGQGDQRDPVQELFTKRETEEQTHTHRREH